jgi:hypothetical protein
MRLSGLFESDADDYTDAPVVEALAWAAEHSSPAAWEHAGIVAANHVISYHPELVGSELAQAQAEWDEGSRQGRNWLALIGGYRDTLSEYVARGADI